MRKWTDEPPIDALQPDDQLMVSDVTRTVGQRNTVATVAQVQEAVTGDVQDQISAGVIPRGSTADRPAAADVDTARLYWDETLGKLICHDGTDWVNLDGSSL